ncbi:hypothetical protein AB0A60_21355 [Streptomyces sp. NPDC046275]|uniref:hypothetical protein n=1 Tax=Streptomyces sp. NPDC046275 TaxID=3157201 RepID=UPI0033CDA513
MRREQFPVTGAARPALGQRRQGLAGRCNTGSGAEQGAGERFLCVQGGQHGAPPGDGVQDLPAQQHLGHREIGERAVDVGHQVQGQQRQRGPQPADPPGRGGPAGAGHRVDEVQYGVRGGYDAEQPQIRSHPPVHGPHHRHAAQQPARGGPRDVECQGQAVGHRGDPQVLLQWLKDTGQRLRHRPGAQQPCPAGRLDGHGGDRTRLEQPQRAVAAEAELHVLRAAELAAGLLRQLDQGGHLPP